MTTTMRMRQAALLPMDNPYIFDRQRLRLRRHRAAKDFATYRFLKEDMADRIMERLDDCDRPFPLVLDIGAHDGYLTQQLRKRPGTKAVIGTDLSERFAALIPKPAVVADEEFLPFKAGSVDLIVSCMSVHWINDVPGMLAQLHQILAPNGLLILSFLGGQTLSVLRQAFLQAEMELGIPVSPHVSPFIDVKDAGQLLQRAGFELPIADSDIIQVSYSSILNLFIDLRGMGETNLVHIRAKTGLKRALLTALQQHYYQLHHDEEGRLIAEFDVVTMTGVKSRP